MADIALLLDLADRALHKRHVFRDHANLLQRMMTGWLVISDYPDPFFCIYAIYLEAKQEHLFLATGTFHREISDRSGISQSSMSCIIPDVLHGLIRLQPQYIKFPYNLAHKLEMKQRLFAIANVPNIIGAIDCTHICIKAASNYVFAFQNRKNYHSINVQLIFDAKCALLINAVACWNSR